MQPIGRKGDSHLYFLRLSSFLPVFKCQISHAFLFIPPFFSFSIFFSVSSFLSFTLSHFTLVHSTYHLFIRSFHGVVPSFLSYFPLLPFPTVLYFPIFQPQCSIVFFPHYHCPPLKLFHQSTAHIRFFPPNFTGFVPVTRHLGLGLTFSEWQNSAVFEASFHGKKAWGVRTMRRRSCKHAHFPSAAHLRTNSAKSFNP